MTVYAKLESNGRVKNNVELTLDQSSKVIDEWTNHNEAYIEGWRVILMASSPFETYARK